MSPRSIIVSVLLSLSLSSGVHANLILDVGPGGTAIECGTCSDTNGQTFGWAFQLTGTIQVDGIGVWDSGADGIGPSVQAGLWVDTGVPLLAGPLLASVIVSDSSSSQDSNGAGQWLFEDIEPLTLLPGIYIVGTLVFSETPLAQFDTAFTTIPQVTYTQGRKSFGTDSGFTAPLDPFSIIPDGVFGPTLRIAEIPSPATLALFSLGLAALGWSRRRKATVSK